jgi:hypothetical protein
MAGNKEGAAKAAKTNKAKYGKDFYAQIGSKSWDNPDRSHETGFALLSPEERKRLGAIGGRKNKGKKYKKHGTPEEWITPEEIQELSADTDTL